MLAEVNSKDDLKALIKLRNALDLVQTEIDPDMPIGYFRTMLELMIAHHDVGPHARQDLTQKDLLERTNIRQSTLSRAVNALADKRQLGNPYHIADNTPHPLDRRFRHVRLNGRGEALMRQLVAVLNK